MSFERKRLIDNIYRVAKEKDINIGTLEEEAGVSKGYLSRLAKKEDKGTFGVDLLCSIADTLEKTLDALVYEDTESLTENEKYMLDFLDRLTLQTEKRSLEWEMMPPDIQDTMFIYEHPLFRTVERMDEDYHSTPYFYETNEYCSAFMAPETLHVDGNCFFTMIDEFSRTQLYIMEVSPKTYGTNPNRPRIKELYFIRNGKAEPVACTELLCDQVKEAVERLYNAIEEARSNLRINTSSKSVIDRFMKKE